MMKSASLPFHPQRLIRAGIGLTLALAGWGSLVTSYAETPTETTVKRWSSAEGEWSIADDWRPEGTPRSADFVVVDNGGLLRLTGGEPTTVMTLNVGHTATQGNNALEIASGAALTVSTHGNIGFGPGTEGRLTVSGKLSVARQLMAGGAGQGVLEIKAGGEVEAHTIIFGHLEASSGKVIMEAGGQISSQVATLGIRNEAKGEGVVAGEWKNASNFVVGHATAGKLEVQPGARVENGGILTIGELEGGDGVVTVRGEWHQSGGLFRVSRMGKAILTLGEGGTVVLAEPERMLYLAHLAHLEGGSQAHGVLNIGGMVDGHEVQTPEAPGLLKAEAVLGNDRAGAAEVNFNHTATGYFFSEDGTANGHLIPLRGGRLKVRVFNGTTIFPAPNPYGGGTEVHGGELVVTDPGALGSGPVRVVGGALRLAYSHGESSEAPRPVELAHPAARCLMIHTNGGRYDGLAIQSVLEGGRPVVAQLKGGVVASGAREVEWRVRLAQPAEQGVVSDVVRVSGSRGDLYVLELQAEGVGEGAVFARRDGSGHWHPVAPMQTLHRGSYEQFRAAARGKAPAASQRAHGFDATARTVWATVSGDGEFAVLKSSP